VDFRYSDINFILLGALLENISGEAEDVYVRQNVFAPLGMADTGFRPSAALLGSIAPTAHDEENAADPGKNPDFGHLLRGTVHDTTARRMGGVAGHAGLFSTAHDVGIFAQALLDRLAGRPSEFPLQQATLELMTTPQQPGHNPDQLDQANAATIAKSNKANPLLAASYPAIAGQNLRGFGWDIDTRLSTPRGLVFPIGSFGHTGFTGTTVWLDPGSDTYVVLLSNSILVRGSAPIQNLRGEVATATARALHLYGT
jgi:CubicO group peptidase (beta-lactamase class C family)